MNKAIATAMSPEMIPEKAAVSCLTDSLTGILSEKIDMKQAKEERLKEKYENPDGRKISLSGTKNFG